jgi:WD40 repeat protein
MSPALPALVVPWLTRPSRQRLLALCAMACVFGSTALAAASVFRPLSGSPFAIGLSPVEVRFGPTGRMLAVSGWSAVRNNVVTRWEAALFSFTRGTAPQKLPGALMAGSRGLWFGPFAPDGKFVVVYDSPNRPPTGVATYAVGPTGLGAKVSEHRFPKGSIPNDAHFSPDGKFLAVADAGAASPEGVAGPGTAYPAVWMFAVGSGGSLRNVGGSPFLIRTQPSSSNVDAVAFSPDGKLLAVADGSDNRLLIYSVSPSGALGLQPLSSHQTLPGPASLSFSPNGKLLAVADGGAGAVSVFSVGGKGKLTRTRSSPLFSGAIGPTEVAFSPSGKQFAVANEGGRVGVFSVLDGGRARRVALLEYPGADSVSYNPGGTLLAVAGGKRLAVFSTR